MSRFPERIDSRRLVMRLWEDADAPALHEAIRQSLDHLRPWMDWIAGEPLTPAQRLGFVRHVRLRWEQDVEAIYGVFLDEAVIGGCGLHRRQGPGAVEIGYWIHVAHTRQGYATELSAALTTTAFADPAIERVEIHHAAGNLASAGVPRRLGFARRDLLPGADGEWVMERAAWRD